MSSPCHIFATNRTIGIYFSTCTYLLCVIWNSMLREPIRVLIQMKMWFRIWHGKEFSWGALCKNIFFSEYWHWYLWQQLGLRSRLPPLLPLFTIPMMLWKTLWTTWIVLNSWFIQVRISQIYVLKYWYMLSALIAMDTLIPSTLAISLEYLRIILILHSVSGRSISTMRLRILLRKLLCVMRISCNPKRLLPTSHLFERLRMNTVTLLTQISGNLPIARKNLKMSLFFW